MQKNALRNKPGAFLFEKSLSKAHLFRDSDLTYSFTFDTLVRFLERSKYAVSGGFEKTKPKSFGFSAYCGGDEGDRTPYLLNAIQALSQVSYTPTA